MPIIGFFIGLGFFAIIGYILFFLFCLGIGIFSIILPFIVLIVILAIPFVILALVGELPVLCDKNKYILPCVCLFASLVILYLGDYLFFALSSIPFCLSVLYIFKDKINEKISVELLTGYITYIFVLFVSTSVFVLSVNGVIVDAFGWIIVAIMMIPIMYCSFKWLYSEIF
jgi:hypothetical protein